MNSLRNKISGSKRQFLSLILRELLFRVRHSFQNVYAKWALWRWGATFGRGLKVRGWLQCHILGHLVLGENVQINSCRDRNYVGGDRKTAFWVGPNGNLEIADDVGISGTTIVVMESVQIGEKTLIGGGCDIYDTDFHEIDANERAQRTGNIKTAPIRIGDNVFVGGHSIILKGVSIGNGAVIGAGSVVTRDIPPYEVWAGRPARKSV